LIGVGYGGLRVVSRDAGLTWGDRRSEAPEGGDDENLLRAVVYGKGRWIATGWQLFTSDDGVTWTNHGMINDGPKIERCNIVEGLAYKDGYFYAACPTGTPSELFRSVDGLEWESFAEIGDTGGHLSLTYRGGRFVSYGDERRSFESVDGLAWSELAGVDEATFCEGEFRSLDECHGAAWFDGAYFKEEWGGYILRSTDGQGFDEVYADDESNTLYRSRAMAKGYVAP
jgi:hypothetical protein